MPRKKAAPVAPAAPEVPEVALVSSYLLQDLVDREVLRKVVAFGASLALQQKDLTRGRDRVTVLVNRIFTPERLEELLRS